MNVVIEIGHRILAVVLMIGYAVLAFRFFRAGERVPTFFETMLAQIVRFSLLLEFVTGILLSLNYKIQVSSWHHWACIIPVLTLAVYQIIRMTRSVSLKNYARVFLIMCAAVLLISLIPFIDS
ncbi:MAG: hypothetical protein U5R06_23675 [candidate division KSB1 bacterium]|nr:hypothetical protein [candidate division KSB1 bacterium]